VEGGVLFSVALVSEVLPDPSLFFFPVLPSFSNPDLVFFAAKTTPSFALPKAFLKFSLEKGFLFFFFFSESDRGD
jgi:hypothetical protein